MTMVKEFVHHELNQEVTALSGHYVLVKEAHVPFRGREVLYLVGHATCDTACCGAGGCAYALVPGFIVDWKARTNHDGLAVSLVEPIHDEAAQREIRQLIEGRETIHQVQFH
ncbi:MAG: hypothetical protein JSV36_01255 [Anaerolineae bacterium]|nr:MAG: hypothetical protein JSV36_01255 [Anaerolineae bacterium]